MGLSNGAVSMIITDELGRQHTVMARVPSVASQSGEWNETIVWMLSNINQNLAFLCQAIAAQRSDNSGTKPNDPNVPGQTRPEPV